MSVTPSAREKLSLKIAVARGDQPADLVLRNGKILDVFTGKWLEGDVAIHDGVIVGVFDRYEKSQQFIDLEGKHLVPGFIDSHVHIESTMMLPSEFARAALPRGTTSAIWDPHEIANVFGVSGLEWALACAESSPMDLFVMLSSCVPSSEFETAGARITASELAALKNHQHALGLAEMMNFPAVIAGDAEVLDKILAFQGRPIDGHSPLLRGKALNAYLVSGISTCHEICSREEAQEKLSKGMRVLIREGSVAKNARDLVPVLTDYSGNNCLICTDDRNPLDIAAEGHIDYILRIAINEGIRPEVVFRSASLSTAVHYGLRDRGAIAPGYQADLVVLADVATVSVAKVFKKGHEVGAPGWDWPVSPPAPRENSIRVAAKPESLKINVADPKASFVDVNVIDVIPNQILTGRSIERLPVINGLVEATANVQKMAVFERHHGSGRVGLGFVRGFGLREGAIGSSVAHDAHNIGIIGRSDAAIWSALEAIKKMGGGIVAVNGQGETLASLPLPVAGLMSRKSFSELIPEIKALRNAVLALGCELHEPFLQMSFLALPVIPALKITDLGLVDVESQRLEPLFVAGTL